MPVRASLRRLLFDFRARARDLEANEDVAAFHAFTFTGVDLSIDHAKLGARIAPERAPAPSSATFPNRMGSTA
jgi:hypothetical protein